MPNPTPCDLLITGGLLASGAGWAPGIVAIRGEKILFSGAGSAADFAAERVIDARGGHVVPGLIDLHTHTYWGGIRLGINPDKMAAISGVTTWVDAGSAGAGGFEGLLRHISDHSAAEIVPFLNFSYIGLGTAGMMTREVGELWDASFGDLRAVLRTAEEHPGAIRGIKVRASANAIGDNARLILPQARDAADELGVPLMIHVGMAPPVLGEVLPFLGRGDILTHCFHPHAGGRIVDARGAVRPELHEAVARGVILDVGHGNASISHEITLTALNEGLRDFTISSDMHSEKAPTMVSLLTVAEMFLAMGLSFAEVIERMTATPAAALGRTDIGSLAAGTTADIAIFELEDAATVKADSLGHRLTLNTRILHRLTLRAGRELLAPEDDRREFFDSPWASKFAQTPDAAPTPKENRS
ncbi:amidohydrolase family protein [Mycetocola spongiae]|uniref:amidohydrolase family protein n=1 Tax=Mycetocola spongiae TaxID=2859226 RepID=UPI001CF46887|nr:amidohydrolase family protein [Mycetocola spongiae]UCR88653.1 amidohydrolase family protein [Mycetocola spongiae]